MSKINLLAYVRLQFLHLVILAFPLYEMNLSPSPNAATSFSRHQFLIHLSLPFLSLGIEFRSAVGGIHHMLRTPHCHPSAPLGRSPWQPGLRVQSTAGTSRAPYTYWLTLWYSLAMPWWVQSFPRVGKMWPRVSDLNKDRSGKSNIKGVSQKEGVQSIPIHAL